jgi:hypothetical protein
VLGASGGYAAKKRLGGPLAEERVAINASEDGTGVRTGGKASGSRRHGHGVTPPVYMKFSRQFIAPLSATRNSLMILDIQIELDPSAGETAYGLEPRLRDAFLKALLETASRGELAGIVSDPALFESLRATLLERARAELGPAALSVLILDVAVQHR